MNVPLRSSADRLAELLLRVHHDRSVPGHWFFDRLAGHEQEPDSFVSRLHYDFVAAVEQHERSVAAFVVADRVGAGRRFPR